jgi:hypothetical protein
MTIKDLSRIVLSSQQQQSVNSNKEMTPGTDYLNQNVEIHHEPDPKGAFKALQQKGIKITNYKEDIPR